MIFWLGLYVHSNWTNARTFNVSIFHSKWTHTMFLSFIFINAIGAWLICLIVKIYQSWYTWDYNRFRVSNLVCAWQFILFQLSSLLMLIFMFFCSFWRWLIIDGYELREDASYMMVWELISGPQCNKHAQDKALKEGCPWDWAELGKFIILIFSVYRVIMHPSIAHNM